MAMNDPELDPAIVKKIWDKNEGFAKDVRGLQLEDNLRKAFLQEGGAGLGLSPNERFPIDVESAKQKIEAFIEQEKLAQKRVEKVASPSTAGLFAQRDKRPQEPTPGAENTQQKQRKPK